MTARAQIRVLHVGLGSHLGGIETYLKKISSAVDHSIYQFDFLTYTGTTPCFYSELSELGCGFHFVTGRREGYFRNLIELNRLFASKTFDIVHCHLNSLSYIAPCMAALRQGCKVIVHSRNAGHLGSFHSEVLHQINSRRLPKGKVECVAVSDLAGAWMFGPRAKFLVLNNGVDTNEFRFSAGGRMQIREEFHLADKELILHIGAFRKQKNHSFLLNVFREYLLNHPGAILMLVGTGELLEQIKEEAAAKGISDRVIFAGQRNDVGRMLSAADKFLLPSFYEGLPNSLLEAQSSGLPCVVSDSITQQAVVDGLCCRIGLDEPVSKWVEALSRPVVENRGVWADRVAHLGFGLDTEIRRLTDLYERLAGNQSGSNNKQ